VNRVRVAIALNPASSAALPFTMHHGENHESAALQKGVVADSIRIDHSQSIDSD
jgi:hypothetical protein